MTVPVNAGVDGPRAEAPRARPGRAARAGRWLGAVALLVVAVVLAVASITAVFVREQLLDTDRYVATVAPLARDPVVQGAIADRLAREVVTRADLAGLAREAAAWLRAEGAPPAVDQLLPPAVSGVESFVHSEVLGMVRTERFAAAWDEANRVAHDDLRAVLTGGSSGAVASAGTDVTVDLGAVLETVRQHLVAAGFTLAGQIPRVSVPFTVYSSPDLPTIRRYVTWLDRVATWLPWLVLALLAGAVALAPDRRRGLLLAGLSVAVGLLLARGGMALARDHYLDGLSPGVDSREVAAHVLDTVTRGVREFVTLAVAVGLLVAAGAWLAGPGRLPVGLRQLVTRGVDAAGAGLDRAGLRPGRPHAGGPARRRAA
ncbi:hypothetical protein RB614_10665 [Phytohabitans sp. ZYX-F-186]|uniref:Integral membrane protein n=1 Tax=Phytohabitans maris TaxID=3071409 RepID=A0ABU0ZD49_9ACTN|nr:hypothetical protein [Phytohabitans sp. ZYX-F-186]MDQ7904984.1 hypothetical protein [Phytohabitans sp. ZYX-F-186]